MKRIFAIALLSAASAACVPAIPAPTAEHILIAERTWPAITLNDLARGRDTYLERCSSCHMVYTPTRYGAAKWPELVAKMRARAHLQPSEEQDVVRYLTAVAQIPPRT